MSEMHEVTEIPSHQACAHCRSQKVRCIPDAANQDVCQRCARSGRACVFTPVQKRRQRKRTDTRVAELEREMQTMRSMLKGKETANRTSSLRHEADVGEHATKQQQYGSSTTISSSGVSVLRQDATEQYATGNGTISKHTSPPTVWPSRSSNNPVERSKDVIDSGILSMATARQLFETYKTDLFQHYPLVPIAPSFTADTMRETKPSLFLAVLAAAATKDHPDLSATLDQQVLHNYAAKSLLQSEKSLELVQALLVSSIWYHPPNKFQELKYYEYIHMAATTATVIGITTRKVHQRSNFGDSREVGVRRPPVHHLEDVTNPDLSMTPRSETHSPSPTDLESKRTLLALYCVCAGVSMTLKRSNMLRVSSYIRESADYLHRSPNAMPSDRVLVAWVRLMIIGEDISTSFSYDDPGGVASISDLSTQLMLRDYRKRLDDWHSNTPDLNTHGSLAIVYWTTRLYLNEIALHLDHSPEDFKAPFQMGVIHECLGEDLPTQVLAEAIAECITSAHHVFDQFLSMEPKTLRALPVFGYVRISFAAFVLAKLCLSAAHPKSRIGAILDSSSLQAERYINEAILHVREIVGPVRSRVPAIFLALLFKLRQWCLNPAMIEQSVNGTREHAMDLGYDAVGPQDVRHETSSATSGVGPRLIAQVVSDDDSPVTSTSGQLQEIDSTTFEISESAPETMLDTATGAATEVQQPAFFLNANHGMEVQQPAGFYDANGPMELDQNFFQMYGDMDGLAAGGLTGLDDWTSLPLLTDIMGLPNDFNWQANLFNNGGVT